MIVERLVWRAKFGQGDQVSQAFSKWRTRYGERFGLSTRILTDVTGPLFTVVVESEYRDMEHVDQADAELRALFGDAEFQQWFGSWQDAVDGGTRELYAVVD